MKTTVTLALAIAALSGCMSNVEHVPPTRGGEYFEEVHYADNADSGTKAEVGSVDGSESPLSSSNYIGPMPKFNTPKQNGVILKRWFKQGENPSDDSKLQIKPNGEVSVVTGTSRANTTVIPPPPDYTKYIALVAGLLMIGWGIYSLSIGWERIGTRFIVYGSAASVVALTVEKNSGLYALALIALALYVAYEKFKAYRKGETDHGNP